MDAIGRGQDDNDHRWYEQGFAAAMSVTTVLGYLDEDTSGLDYWKSSNQGMGDDFHHEHVYWYSSPRGTLCHSDALTQLTDESLWGPEEKYSLRQIVDGPDGPEGCDDHDEYQDDCKWCYDGEFDDASHDASDVAYSILKNKEVVTGRDQYQALFSDTSLVDICLTDVQWTTEKFNDIADSLGIDDESVIAVEYYLLDEEDYYAGQCDLLYRDRDGNVVMADLKTSSGLRQKHVLQSVAYSRAVERDSDLEIESVDRHEVIRLSPDKKEYEVHTDVLPSDAEDFYEAKQFYDDPYGDYHFEDTDAMYDAFMTCVTDAYESVTQHTDTDE
jgi:hypothetical protein